jgi:uncharacterized protein (TIGR04222 family)
VTGLAAPGDTWGVSGPTFALGYALAALLLLGVVLMWRRAAAAGPIGPFRSLAPMELAYVNGGEQLALYSSLAALRASGAVSSDGSARIVVSGPLPPQVSALDHAVYVAAQRGVKRSMLARDTGVRAVLDRLRDGLAGEGWLLGDEQRARLRVAVLPLFLLVLLGGARVLAGLANGRPVVFVVLETMAVATAAVVLLLRAPRISRAGRRAVNAARVQHQHLAPALAPSWAVYGMGGAALGVALYGTAALWAADPAFAAQAEIQRQAAAGASGSTGATCGSHSSDSGSSGDSGGGSSCGGGGGCGGGGCGG